MSPSLSHHFLVKSPEKGKSDLASVVELHDHSLGYILRLLRSQSSPGLRTRTKYMFYNYTKVLGVSTFTERSLAVRAVSNLRYWLFVPQKNIVEARRAWQKFVCRKKACWCSSNQACLSSLVATHLLFLQRFLLQIASRFPHIAASGILSFIGRLEVQTAFWCRFLLPFFFFHLSSKFVWPELSVAPVFFLSSFKIYWWHPIILSLFKILCVESSWWPPIFFV